MRVFISWSGERSRLVAEALQAWLPSVIQRLDPWMSAHSIDAGARWGGELAKELEAQEFGVLCLTPENVGAPWLLFEAVALSKSVKTSRVVPYRLGLPALGVGPPLSQFQGVDASQEGTQKLIDSSNQAQDAPLDKERLERTFQWAWPELGERLKAIGVPAEQAKIQGRNEMDYLAEILEIVRGLKTPSDNRRDPDLREVASLVEAALSKAEGKVRSMEDYEAKGGGASTEPFWDTLIQDAREEQARLLAAARALRPEGGA